MTDEARIARLTELARRAWPELAQDVMIQPIRTLGGELYTAGYGVRTFKVLVQLMHPRALDALEAALLVLSGEGYFYVSRAQYVDQHPPPPPWVEQLASQKVTDDMVERGYYSITEPTHDRGDVRRLLEAALADVPEPSCMVTGGFDEQAGRYHAEARAQAAEAKLAEVREQAERWARHSGDETYAVAARVAYKECAMDFLTVVDGEPCE